MRPSVHYVQLYRNVGEAAVWWRAMSSNGRPLGRCVAPADGLDAATAHLRRVVALLDGAEVTVRATSTHGWRWTLVAGDEPLATGAHENDRRTRCVMAGRYFVATLPAAAQVRTVEVFGRRDLPLVRTAST